MEFFQILDKIYYTYNHNYLIINILVCGTPFGYIEKIKMMKNTAELQKNNFYQFGIVIPLLNDDIRITNSEIMLFAENNPSVQICFIVDDSSKNTIDKLKQIQFERTDNIIVNTFKTLPNKVEAIRLGMLFLNNYTNVANIGYLDPSINISLENYLTLAKYKEHFPQFGIAFGSRIPYVNNQYDKISFPKSKSLINRLYQVFDKTVLRTGFQDIFCGAKSFNRNLIPFLFNEPFKDTLLFEFELLLRLQKKFGKSSIQKGIVEFPIFKWNEFQTSPLPLSQVVQLPINLFNLYYEYSLSSAIKNKLSGFTHSIGQAFSVNSKKQELSTSLLINIKY
jgi:dolichyl-phosphate beta-glucosyltransferase